MPKLRACTGKHAAKCMESLPPFAVPEGFGFGRVFGPKPEDLAVGLQGVEVTRQQLVSLVGEAGIPKGCRHWTLFGILVPVESIEAVKFSLSPEARSAVWQAHHDGCRSPENRAAVSRDNLEATAITDQETRELILAVLAASPEPAQVRVAANALRRSLGQTQSDIDQVVTLVRMARSRKEN